MKNIFYLFLFFLGTLFNAQRTTVVAKITFNDGRTEDSKIYVITNLFDSKLLDEKSVAGKKITIASADGKKVKLLAADIQKIDFTDFKDKERHFTKMPGYNNLVELKYDGKVKWFKLYGENAYDHSTTMQDYLYIGNKSYFFSILKNNPKKLKEFFAGRTDLYPLIDNINYNKLNEKDLYTLLRKYDE